MNSKKLLLIFIMHFSLFFISCSQKGKENITQKNESYKHIKEHNQTKKEEPITFKFMQNIDKICHIKTKQEKNDSLKVLLDEENNFDRFSDKLSKQSYKKLLCISDILLRNPKQLYIVITGHATESSTPSENQHLSADRAITVAELFYTQGVRDEIFAKGCADKNPTTQREIKIFIHEDKSTIKNHCK
jgi:outer membrane protein OmpA-like peptidoglycan-associated protein